MLIKNEHGRYLLIKRSQPLSDGTGIMWDIPGGRINSDERLEDALKRELLEEIGVDLDQSVQLLRAQDIIINDIDTHIVRLTCHTELSSDITLSDEYQAVNWVTQKEALGLNVDPYLREVLETI